VSSELAGALTGALGGEVDDLQRLSGGASRETWALTLDGEPLVLQRERPGGIRTGGGMAAEADLIRAAGAEGVPVAEVVATGSGEDDGLGAPWVVARRVEGETIPRRILRDDEFAGARDRLADQCGAALAAIHRVDPTSVTGLHEMEQVGQFRDLVDVLGQPHPAFELGFRWLEANRPPPTGRSVVHGDFRHGNLIVGPEGLRAVLDWELAHLGDPMEDLGWLCVRAWRFGGDGPVGGFGRREDLYAAYEAAGGRPVDPEVARWWEVLGTLKWGVMCIIQTATHLTGQTRSVELAAIGRRVCENEYDLLALVDPDGVVPEPTPAAAAAPSFHDVPSAAELLVAVREWVEGDAREATTGRVQFHTRVVANVVSILERELASGPAMAAAHSARLAALGAASERELADRIRAGEWSVEDRAVLDAVRATVVDKLAVANPKYL
jgi:aminoglycoside phosphotransferase (APT) family kinase protein